MNYPIVKVTTKDKLILHGVLCDAQNSDTIIIQIHGSGSNFYEEDFIENMALEFPKKGFSFLSTNNRGNSVMTHSWQKAGSGLEKFEDCILDINSWIEFAMSKGYKKIILQGHSLGTEKIVYYMNKGKYKDKVKTVILLGFSDSYGTEMQFLEKNNFKDKLFKEAKDLIDLGKGEQFLTSVWHSHAGVLQKSAKSFINNFEENSELSKAFPLRKGKNLEMYQNISVPILGIIGDKKEYVIIPIKDAVKLLEKENKNAKCIQLKNCPHDFEGKEKELVKNILDFLR